MPYVFTNGIRLAFERHGRGERVLMIMGSGAGGRVFTMHQTPALAGAGYQAITFDNRGIPPSDVPPGRYSLDDMVLDAKGIIDGLGAAPCRIVGVSLGAVIAQELAIRWPELVRCAVLIGTKARTDAARRAYNTALQSMAENGFQLPQPFEAVTSAFMMLSPATLNDEPNADLWMQTLELFTDSDRKAIGQLWADDFPDRRAALRGVRAPCRVIAFTDDLITPPHLAAEVAEAIPDCDYVQIGSGGHFGYLEQPGEVNAALLEFLSDH